jgi:predicted amino acid dehydrogenase
MAAIVDQMRIAEDSQVAFAEYLLNWFEKTGVSPNRIRPTGSLKRRCAFLIHPLHQKQIWQAPGLGFMAGAPGQIRAVGEHLAARIPAFHAGTVTGVRSLFDGQEVECDLYAIPATPKQLLAMDPEFAYTRIVECIELAKSRGASMMGLGAYTKVIGDAGVTIARRSSIPVTNGNSYSASTTLWAARVMVEKIGVINPQKEGVRLRAKAMVVGATGSIGRVSALLASTVFTDVVLVANRPDKLLELKDEILRVSPGVRVTITTNANSELIDTDLIVTATSNQSGKILDIEMVKPGAVICDCSRPLDIGVEDASKRPDVLVIESGEVLLPGNPYVSVDIGLPQPSVYACLAETVLLTMEGRYESFSLSKQLSMEKTKEIYRLGLKHGANLSAIQGPLGVISEELIQATRSLALERLKTWPTSKREIYAGGPKPGLRIDTLLPPSQTSTFQEVQ